MRFAARQYSYIICPPLVPLLTSNYFPVLPIHDFFPFLIRSNTIREFDEVELSLSFEEDNDTSLFGRLARTFEVRLSPKGKTPVSVCSPKLSPVRRG